MNQNIQLHHQRPKSFTSLSRSLLILGCLSIFSVNLIMVLLSLALSGFHLPELGEAFRSTVTPHIIKFFTFSQTGDSWHPMFKALDYLQSNHQETAYSKLFFGDNIKFQYPLTSLLPLVVLRKLVPDNAQALSILNILSWISIPITIFFTIKLFNIGLQRQNHPQTRYLNKGSLLTTSSLIVGLSLSFYPFIKAYGLGQIQAILNCLFSISMWAWATNRTSLAGVLVGSMILIKPQYIVIAIWGCLRGKWSFVRSALLICTLGVVSATLIFGIQEQLDYLKVLSFISRHGEIFYPNQSINGLLNRLLFNGDSLQFTNSFPPFHPIVYIGTLVSSTLLLAAALFYSQRSKYRSSIIDYAIIAITCTVASPVAWEHHYGILLPIYIFFLAYIVGQVNFNKGRFIAMSAAYLISASNMRIFNIFTGIPLLNILQSYLLFSVFVLLACLYSLATDKQDVSDL
ncbi:MAG: glycosyltransferase family 87 protein [Nostocales cyanobacterium 94392]|nr:glycosyltransferase family 87 protein [Nostocales cyanobacterium 94392]